MSQKLEATAELKYASSADKFYVFFKNNMNDLINVFPASFKSVQLLEGEEGSIGCVKLWNYVIGGIPMTVKAKTEAIDDDKRSITFVAFDGDLMQLYKSFKATLTVNDGFANWSIEYEKAHEAVPSPDIYAALTIKVSNLVENYLLKTN
ncbi:Polyketide cyclase/dehydrase and lipid transport superfamily protein [Forsythia ovata]|uniref:Polyketide cyclase/dehydrase and lipid transport superfamily protein n=1 Tax=Forsythia ovata TaxID=205694 RepID=A0ABD1UC47_9LAMI